MIIEKASMAYIATFELRDKNLYLTYDNNELYFINFPSTESRKKEMRYMQFNEGFIETIVRLSI